MAGSVGKVVESQFIRTQVSGVQTPELQVMKSFTSTIPAGLWARAGAAAGAVAEGCRRGGMRALLFSRITCSSCNENFAFQNRTTLYYIAHIFEHRKQPIIADDNQGYATAQSQLVNAFISAFGYNDTHVRNYANPVDLLWEFTVCQGAPRHSLQLVEKISSVFLWATLHRVGFTHGTTRDQDERDA
jgi:hypothetical protein